MTRLPHTGVRRRRLLTILAAILGLAALVSACSSSAGAAGNATTSVSSDPNSSVSASSDSGSSDSAIPTQDVVSGVKEDAKLHAELPADVRKSGKLVLGTTYVPGTSALPHFGQTSDGTNVGLDVDLRNAVAKVLGISWDVQNGTFDTIIPGVQNGKYQVGQDNFGVTKEREQVVDFATYLTDGQAFLGASSVPLKSVSTLQDVCGYTIATSPGTTFQQLLTTGAKKCASSGKKPWSVQYFSDSAPIFLGLQNGKIDLYFGPTDSVKYDAAHIPNTKYLGQLSSTPVGFVTAKGSPIAKALSDAVNRLIADGTYAKIFAKWDVAGTGVSKSQVNPPAAF